MTAVALGLVPSVADVQAARLAAFRRRHPQVSVGADEYRHWQARIPARDGERVIVRYTLRELLDKLDVLLPAEDDQIIGLYRSGLSMAQVAARTGEGMSRVRRAVGRAGVVRPRRPRVTAEQARERDGL